MYSLVAREAARVQPASLRSMDGPVSATRPRESKTPQSLLSEKTPTLLLVQGWCGRQRVGMRLPRRTRSSAAAILVGTNYRPAIQLG